MNFSKTTEYSLRILGFMAIEDHKLYSAEVLNQNLDIPFRYLRKQLTRLTNGGFLISYRGKAGGYKIAKPLNEITLWDIVNATGEDSLYHECIFGFDSCAFGNKCALHHKWAKIQNSINDMLKNTTLEELKRTKPERFTIQHNLMLTKNV